MKRAPAQRHAPAARTTWLVAWRHGLNRDLRRKLLDLVIKQQFDWESEELRTERVMMRCYSPLWKRVTLEVLRVVEECDGLPFPRDPDDTDLRLRHVRVKPYPFLRKLLLARWHWLHPR